MTATAGQKSEQKSEGRPPLPPKVVLVEKVTGTVKWFHVKSGYGFIEREDNKEDVFVHRTAIPYKNSNKRHFVRSLDTGETVEFQIVEGRRGPEAWTVTGPEGGKVRGSYFAPVKWWLRPRGIAPARRRATTLSDDDQSKTRQGEKKTPADDKEKEGEKEAEGEPGREDKAPRQQKRRKRPPRPHLRLEAATSDSAKSSGNTATASSKAEAATEEEEAEEAAARPRRPRRRRRSGQAIAKEGKAPKATDADQGAVTSILNSVIASLKKDIEE